MYELKANENSAINNRLEEWVLDNIPYATRYNDGSVYLDATDTEKYKEATEDSEAVTDFEAFKFELCTERVNNEFGKEERQYVFHTRCFESESLSFNSTSRSELKLIRALSMIAKLIEVGDMKQIEKKLHNYRKEEENKRTNINDRRTLIKNKRYELERRVNALKLEAFTTPGLHLVFGTRKEDGYYSGKKFYFKNGKSHIV